MQVIKVKYSGAREFYDNTAMANIWQPGEVKVILQDAARELLRFGEFQVVDEPMGKNEVTTLLKAKAQSIKEKEDTEENEIESQIVNISMWDKHQLEAYGTKYDVNIDKRKSIEKLRAEVSNLIEQFGVR